MSSVAGHSVALPRPYRWGRFQGWFTVLIGVGFILAGLWLHNTKGAISVLVGLFPLFMGIGIATRRKYGVVLLYVCFIFVLLEKHLPHSDDALFPFVHISELLFWGSPQPFTIRNDGMNLDKFKLGHYRNLLPGKFCRRGVASKTTDARDPLTSDGSHRNHPRVSGSHPGAATRGFRRGTKCPCLANILS
jgi:hypothetical protein